MSPQLYRKRFLTKIFKFGLFIHIITILKFKIKIKVCSRAADQKRKGTAAAILGSAVRFYGVAVIPTRASSRLEQREPKDRRADSSKLSVQHWSR